MQKLLLVATGLLIVAGQVAAQQANKPAYDTGVRLAKKRGVPDVDCYGKIWERHATLRSDGIWFVQGSPEIRAAAAQCGDNFAWQSPKDANNNLKGWEGVWGRPERMTITVRGKTVRYTYNGQDFTVSNVSMSENRLSFSYDVTGYVQMTMNPDRTAKVEAMRAGRLIGSGNFYRGKQYNP